MGLVPNIFTGDVLHQLIGPASIGHTRYSTTGSSNLTNAQPLTVDCAKGKIAIGHNGNLTNALTLRRELQKRGCLFQSTSDTEVVTHLIRRSVEIKAEIVSGDERESGRRAILNAGHTIGHALEQVSGYQLAHGDRKSTRLNSSHGGISRMPSSA